jgi:V/A-type H+/Na+-transporting ATPase subunit E
MSKLETGIDQLIERVKTESIDKAKAERADLIKQAEHEAQAIIQAAHAKAEALLRDTQAHINKEKKALARELELAARDFSVRLSERLREQMFFPVIKESVRATLKQPDFLKEVLERLIVEYVKENPCNLDVLVPKELRVTLAAFFAGAVFDRLDKNADIRLLDEHGIEGFALIKRGEHYVWDFRAETIALELMRLVEPSLRKYFTAQNKVLPSEILEAAV